MKEYDFFRLIMSLTYENIYDDPESYLIREYKIAERDHFFTLEAFIKRCRRTAEEVRGIFMYYAERFDLDGNPIHKTITNEYHFGMDGYNEEYIILLFTKIEALIDGMITPQPVNNSGIDFKGLSDFLKTKGLVKVTPEALQAMHEYKQPPTNTERPRWEGVWQGAEEFRKLMWPEDKRNTFNKYLIFGLRGLKPDKQQTIPEYVDDLKAFF